MDTARLARAVKEARGSLTQDEILRRADQAGHRISFQTIRNIENEAHASYRPATLLAVDAGLGWPPGTAEDVGNGGPIPPPAERSSSLEDMLADVSARLRQLETRRPASDELTALDALVVVMSRLDDEQFQCVATAVAADPRSQRVG